MIQGIALAAAVFAFGAIAADAQINVGAEVNVPFEFSVGEKTYEAGKYSIKINRQMVAGAALTIQKAGSDEIQTVLLSNGRGDPSKEGTRLAFGSVDGRRFLTGVSTVSSDFALVTSARSDARLAKVKDHGKTKTSL